ncbi:MAG: apolipoprotein N-acyltransferase [Armatimonadetes bacterium]|nr:apolipoprotein N-acyltransferase [Armatimonadota bacterium]
MLRRLRPLGMPVGGGLLLALAFPPFNLLFLAFVALVPLLVNIRGLRFWAAFARGYIFGLAFALPNMFWLEQFVGRWTGSSLLAMVPWLLVCSAFAAYFALFAGVAAKAWNRNWPWAFPLIWAGVEVFRSTIPYLFYPWSLLGASLWQAPALLQPAWWAGPYFLGAWVVLINVVGAMLWLKEDFPARRTWTYVIVAMLIMGGSLLSAFTPVQGEQKRVAAVQPGVDLAFNTNQAMDAKLAVKVPQAIEVGAHVARDLTVLPEGVSRWSGEKPTAPFPIDFVEPTIMGGQRDDAGASYQSLFAFDGKWQAADKVRLVIFGEYVPFRNRLAFLKDFNLPRGDLIPGERVQTLTVGRLRVGGLLCFEALFEEVARTHAANGAEILAVLSLDDWYQGTGAIDALKAGAVLRAVENRMPVVRSASLGPSMIIDSRGNIVAQAPIGTTTTVQAEVLVSSHKPIIVRQWFPWLALAAMTLIALWPVRKGTSA